MILNKYFLGNHTLYQTPVSLQQTPPHSTSYLLRQTADTMGSIVSVSQCTRSAADCQITTVSIDCHSVMVV